MSLFSSSSKVSAVFDIGNGSIGVALVAFSKGKSKGKPATILYTYREPITFLPKPDADHLASSMLRLLKSVSTHLQKTGFSYLPRSIFGYRSVHDVYCVFASPWCHSTTDILSVKKRRPTLITQAFLDELVVRPDGAVATVATPNKSEAKSSSASDTTLIEKKIVRVTLNGYDVSRPTGKKAEEIEMTVFRSTVTTYLLEKIEEVIHSSFHFKTITFSSYALASWTAARDLFPAINDFLFFDVSGEATDVSIVVKGVLEGVESFSKGRAAVIRDIVEEIGVTPDVALSFLTLTLAGKAETNLAIQIKMITQKTITAWLTECIAALKKIQQKYSLPQAVFITVDDDVAGLFCDALRSIHSAELSVPHSVFNLVYVSGDTLRNRNRSLTALVPDPFLSLESIFLAKSVIK